MNFRPLQAAHTNSKFKSPRMLGRVSLSPMKFSGEISAKSETRAGSVESIITRPDFRRLRAPSGDYVAPSSCGVQLRPESQFNNIWQRAEKRAAGADDPAAQTFGAIRSGVCAESEAPSQSCANPNLARWRVKGALCTLSCAPTF